MTLNLKIYLIFIPEDSIDVTNDEEPENNTNTTISMSNFVSHPLYGHTQVRVI